ARVDAGAVQDLLATDVDGPTDPGGAGVPQPGEAADDSRWLRILRTDLGHPPHEIPFVDDSRVELEPDGRFRHNVAHLLRPVGQPQFSWPLLTRFRVAGRLETEAAHATVV